MYNRIHSCGIVVMWSFRYCWTFTLSIHIQSNHHKMHYNLRINIQDLYPSLILRAFLSWNLDSAVRHEIKHITEHTGARAHTQFLNQRISPFAPSHAWKVQRLWPESSAVRSDVMCQAGSQLDIKWIRYKSEMLWLDKGSKSIRRGQWLVNYWFMSDIAQNQWLALGGVWGVTGSIYMVRFKLDLCGSCL